MTGAGDGVEARILAAAQKRLRRDGLRRLTVVGVAEDAGMTHANVYRYFRSKADLADHILGDWLRDIERRLADVSQSPDPADDKLERFLTLLARGYGEKAAADRMVFAVFIDALDQGRFVARRHQDRVRELMVRVIEEGVSTHLLAGADARRIELLISDVLHRFLDPHAIARDASLAPQGGVAEARRERALRLLLRGVAAGRF